MKIKTEIKIRPSFLSETIVGIAAILFINFIWFKYDIGFVNALTNPYWIIVIFIAARYGSLQGLISAVLCSIALTGSVSYDQLFRQSNELFRMPYKQIELSVLFILFAFLIGEERKRMNSLLEKRKEQYNKLRNEFEVMAIDTLALRNINVELEGRVLGQKDSFKTLYEVAKNISSTQLHVLYPSIINLVKKFIEPEKCRLYIWESGEYILKGSFGWGSEVENKKVLDQDTDIIKLASADKRLVTAKDIFKVGNLKWQENIDPKIVAPLFFGEEKKMVVGFIVIDEISFIKLNPDSINFLTIMSDWFSRALDTAYLTSTFNLKDIYDEEIEVFNYPYGMRRLKEEFMRSQVASLSFSLRLIKIADFEGVNETLQKESRKALVRLLKKTLRASDTIAHYNLKDTFMLICLDTNAAGAKVLTERINNQIQSFNFQPLSDMGKKLVFKVSAVVFDPKYQTENELLVEAEKQLNA